MTFPMLVINRAADVKRREAFCDAAKGYDVTFIDAVDARAGAGVFKPYLGLLRDQFWLGGDIKPGAFACFISHRLAWLKIVDDGIDVALIAEDDSRICAMDWNGIGVVDLTFVNDRAGLWAPSGQVSEVLRAQANGLPRAFGGDGYVLTLNGVKTLLAQSQKDGIVCGVDWYLLYAGLDTENLKHRDVVAVPEVKRMWKVLGPRAPILNSRVAQKPWLINAKNNDSSINHSHRINIKLFRQAIENV